MKTVRVLLLVVLAMLLPLRGALAEVAHCVGMPDTASTAAALASPEARSVPDADAGHEHENEHEHHGDHPAQPDAVMVADAGTAAPAAHDHVAGSVDKCHLCTASCASTPFMSAPPTVAEPMPVAGARYPSLTAPAPSHPSEGQERPPRSV